eukprot:scpid65241/ scgid6691/ Far upstream element-binding protein 3
MDVGHASSVKRPHDTIHDGYEHPAKKVAGHNGDSSTDFVTIPQRLVSSVIGRNGELLAKFEAESGASISCQNPPSNSTGEADGHIKISGSSAQVIRAKQLITKFIGVRAGGGTSEAGIAGAFPKAVPGVGLIRPNIVAGLLANVGLAGRGLQMLGVPAGLAGLQVALSAARNLPGAQGGEGGQHPGPGFAQGQGFNPAAAAGAPLPPLPPGHDRFEMMVTKSSAGLVIGKGGDTIKRLQAETGCRIQLIQDGVYANATEKPLRLEGPRDAVQLARAKISEIISNDSQNISAINPANKLEMLVPRESVGSIIGKGGETIKRIQAETGVNIQFKPDGDGELPPQRVAILNGMPDSLPKAKAMVESIVGEHGGYDGSAATVSVSVSVPPKHTGLIIGRGGETIRQMQTESGAHIELIRDAVQASGDKVFLVRGTAEQCKAAEGMIRSKFEQTASSSGSHHTAAPEAAPTATDDSTASSILANLNTESLVKYIQTGKYEAPSQATPSGQSEEQQLAQLQAAGQMWAMQNTAGQQQDGAAAAADPNAAAWAQYYQQYAQQYPQQYAQQYPQQYAQQYAAPAAYPANMQQTQQPMAQGQYQAVPYMGQYAPAAVTQYQPVSAAYPVPSAPAASAQPANMLQQQQQQ